MSTIKCKIGDCIQYGDNKANVRGTVTGFGDQDGDKIVFLKNVKGHEARNWCYDHMVMRVVRPAKPTQMKIMPVCEACGSLDVTRDATAAWSKSKQDWELCGVQDQAYCNKCDGECTIRFISPTPIQKT